MQQFRVYICAGRCQKSDLRDPRVNESCIIIHMQTGADHDCYGSFQESMLTYSAFKRYTGYPVLHQIGSYPPRQEDFLDRNYSLVDLLRSRRV